MQCGSRSDSADPLSGKRTDGSDPRKCQSDHRHGPGYHRSVCVRAPGAAIETSAGHESCPRTCDSVSNVPAVWACDTSSREGCALSIAARVQEPTRERLKVEPAVFPGASEWCCLSRYRQKIQRSDQELERVAADRGTCRKHWNERQACFGCRPLEADSIRLGCVPQRSRTRHNQIPPGCGSVVRGRAAMLRVAGNRRTIVA